MQRCGFTMPVMAQRGRYDDSLVREDGHWKFKRRVASNDIPDMAPAAAIGRGKTK